MREPMKMDKKTERSDFPPMELRLLGRDGKPLDPNEARLILKLKRELYLREHSEEESD